jgi:CheY-like chemotaxis protein
MRKLISFLNKKKKKSSVTNTDNKSQLTNDTSQSIDNKVQIKDQPILHTDFVTTENKNTHDLIVDDSDPNRVVMRKYLTRYGRTADDAINGLDAIEIISKKQNEEYGIIWMDIQMPRLNGIHCTKRLRQELLYKGCIIGLTGHIDEESVEACKLAGMNDILAKPIDKKVLETYLEKYGK